MSTLNDEQLMRLFCDGDTDAFQMLFHKYKNKIFRFIHSVYIRNPSQAEDCAQEVFLRIIRSKDRFDHSLRFSTWLFTIARNYCLNQLRKFSVTDFMQDDLKDALPDAENKNPYNLIEGKELRQTIQNAIFALPENLKAAFILREIEALPYSEIAAILNVREGNIRIQLHRAKKLLREKLSPYVEGNNEY